jgi:hypothetical protein
MIPKISNTLGTFVLLTSIPNGERLHKIRNFIQTYSSDEVSKELFKIFPERVKTTVFFDRKNNLTKTFNFDFIPLELPTGENIPKNTLTVNDLITQARFQRQDLEDLYLIVKDEINLRNIVSNFHNKEFALADKCYRIEDKEFYLVLEIIDYNLKLKFVSLVDIFSNKDKFVFAVKNTVNPAGALMGN